MHAALIPEQDVDDFIILRARSFTRQIQRIMTRDVLDEGGLTLLEWQVLFSVARFGSCHLAYITRNTAIDPAHGSRALAQLEERALISRHEDPGNKRRKVISLTRAGRHVFARLWPKAHHIIQHVTNSLTADELQTFKHLMDKINAAAKPLADDPVHFDLDDPTTPENDPILAPQA